MINRETSLEVTIYYFSFPKSCIMIPFHFNFHDLFFSSELKQHKYSRNIALILMTTTEKKLNFSLTEVTKRKNEALFLTREI